MLKHFLKDSIRSLAIPKRTFSSTKQSLTDAIATTTKELDKTLKRANTMFLLYTSGAVGTFGYLEYQDGKKELLWSRRKRIYSRTPEEHASEDWEAVRTGVQRNFLDNLFRSLAWPLIVIDNIIPAAILLINPRQSQTPVQAQDQNPRTDPAQGRSDD